MREIETKQAEIEEKNIDNSSAYRQVQVKKRTMKDMYQEARKDAMMVKYGT